MELNVLQLIGSFHQGGSERQAVQLTNLLNEDGKYNVFPATLNRKGILLQEMEKAGFGDIPEFPLQSFYDINFLKQVKRFSSYLRTNKIDIIQTHDFYTNVFGMLAAKLAGVTVKIASKRETEGVRTETQNKIEKQVFRIANAIIANSKSVKNYLVQAGIPEKKIDVIYNGVDFTRLEPKETDRMKICGSLGLPSSAGIKFVSQVANLRHDVKNQEMLLAAAARLKDKFPEARFVLAGEGERKQELEALADSLGVSENVYFIGRCTIVPELLSVSYACTLTSKAEGFSNSILEYMYAAKPIVATNVGGANEVITNGETGFLVDSDDDEKLAQRLAALLGDEEQTASFGNAGRQRVISNFSTTTQIENTIALYRRMETTS